MSLRRHIGNPEVRARSRPESRRGRAHRKRLMWAGKSSQRLPPPGRREGAGVRRGRDAGAGRAGLGGRGAAFRTPF
ncbi:centrosomal protein 41 [Homo sapiens]|uniref:Centrosomal protein 41 n=1 Tax=Homo sapiens TaxID=9606 RepID=C9IZ34_HUMAN|nr:centrosomal protein 41 [Homo sapiens]KAI4015847.1 centrosomal protein 41 [Homo sapiens]